MRLTKLRNKMEELKVDATLVLDELNQHYLSEFAFTDGFLFVTNHFICPFIGLGCMMC